MKRVFKNHGWANCSYGVLFVMRGSGITSTVRYVVRVFRRESKIDAGNPLPERGGSKPEKTCRRNRGVKMVRPEMKPKRSQVSRWCQDGVKM